MALNIIGTGHTKFGILEESEEELMKAAIEEALVDAKINFKELDAIYVGNFSSQFTNQSHLSAIVSSIFGTSEVTRVEGACASGALAVKEASIAILSNLYKTILVVGVEKMSNVDLPHSTSILMNAASKKETDYGFTFPSLFALMAQSYFAEFSANETDLALISVKNHKNAFTNELAQFRKIVTINDVMKSKYVASPLKLLDCSPFSDGASAIVITNKHDTKKTKAKILGFGHQSGNIALYDRQTLHRLPAVQLAAKKAYNMASVTPKAISLAEVHDCFTIAELIQMEELGFADFGKAKNLIRSGYTEIHGKLPINTSGGLKAKGHPVGATGISQMVEIVKQFQGKSGERSVRNPSIGLTCNVGGSGATSIVTILKNES